VGALDDPLAPDELEAVVGVLEPPAEPEVEELDPEEEPEDGVWPEAVGAL
jgi:hypothetical protein